LLIREEEKTLVSSMLLTNHNNKIDHERLGPNFRGLIELDMISTMAY
jgi:hypothetical protein